MIVIFVFCCLIVLCVLYFTMYVCFRCICYDVWMGLFVAVCLVCFRLLD